MKRLKLIFFFILLSIILNVYCDPKNRILEAPKETSIYLMESHKDKQPSLSPSFSHNSLNNKMFVKNNNYATNNNHESNESNENDNNERNKFNYINKEQNKQNFVESHLIQNKVSNVNMQDIINLSLNTEYTETVSNPIIFKLPIGTASLSISSCRGFIKSYVKLNAQPTSSNYDDSNDDKWEHQYDLSITKQYYALVNPHEESQGDVQIKITACSSKDCSNLPLEESRKESVSARVLGSGRVSVSWLAASNADTDLTKYSIFIIDDNKKSTLCNYETICGISVSECLAEKKLDKSRPSTQGSDSVYYQEISVTPGKEKDFHYVVMVEYQSKKNIYRSYSFSKMNWINQLSIIAILLLIMVCVVIIVGSLSTTLFIFFKIKRKRDGENSFLISH